MFYPELCTKAPELGVVELLPIVGYDGARYNEPADEVRPYEARYLGFDYGGQRLGLCPLGEIIYGHYSELRLTFPRWQGSN